MVGHKLGEFAPYVPSIPGVYDLYEEFKEHQPDSAQDTEELHVQAD